MNRLLLVFWLLLVCLATHAQNAFTLEEAVNYALDNSLLMKDQILDINRADREISEFLAQGLPQVNGSVNYQYYIDIPTSLAPLFPEQETRFIRAVNGDTIPYQLTRVDENGEPIFGEPQAFQFGVRHNLTAGVNLQALVFDGTFFVGLKASRMYKELLQRERAQTEAEIRDAVRRAYLAVLLTDKSLGILNKNIANLEKTLQETRAIYEEGFAEKLDVDRLDLSLQNLRTDQENLTRAMATSKNMLKFQMGFPLEEKISLTDDIDGLIQRTLAEEVNLSGGFDITRRPEYGVLEQAQELNEVNIQRYQMGYLPTLYANGAYQQQLFADQLSEGQWFPATFVGGTLNVPLFDGFLKRSQIQTAKIDLEKTLIQRELFIRSANMEVTNARIQYLNALQTLRSRERTVDLAEEIYETTQIKYREGVGSSLEVNQAESELYQSQSNYIDALYNLLIAKVDLNKALGK